MKLVFFNTPKTIEAKLLLTQNGLVTLSAALVKLLQVQPGHSMNIALDTETGSYFLCHWPTGNNEMPEVKVKKVGTDVCSFYSTKLAYGVWEREQQFARLTSLKTVVQLPGITDESWPGATIYSLAELVPTRDSDYANVDVSKLVAAPANQLPADNPSPQVPLMTAATNPIQTQLPLDDKAALQPETTPVKKRKPRKTADAGNGEKVTRKKRTSRQVPDVR